MSRYSAVVDPLYTISRSAVTYELNVRWLFVILDVLRTVRYPPPPVLIFLSYLPAYTDTYLMNDTYAVTTVFYRNLD